MLSLSLSPIDQLRAVFRIPSFSGLSQGRHLGNGQPDLVMQLIVTASDWSAGGCLEAVAKVLLNFAGVSMFTAFRGMASTFPLAGDASAPQVCFDFNFNLSISSL